VRIDHNKNWLRFPYSSTFLRILFAPPPALPLHLYHTPAFSRLRRSCQHYVSLLPLRYLVDGPLPFESQCEEAQGLGRQCFRHCRYVSIYNMCAFVYEMSPFTLTWWLCAV
jgi:hypothetical protein